MSYTLKKTNGTGMNRRGKCRLFAAMMAMLLLLIGQAGPLGAVWASGNDYWDYTKASDDEISDAMYYVWYGTDRNNGDSCVFFLDETIDHGGYCVWYADGTQLRSDFCLGTVFMGDRADIVYILNGDGQHSYTVNNFMHETMEFSCYDTNQRLTTFTLSEDYTHSSTPLDCILRIKHFYETLG